MSGTWGKAEQVPGTATLNKGNAQTISVSCASPGNCAAGGGYTDSLSHSQAFVAGEKNGTWQTAEEVPGSGALNKGGSAVITSVSCTSAGNCTAGGAYTSASHQGLSMVAREKGGTWGKAEEVPGSAALGVDSYIQSVSCATAGNCGADGNFIANGKTQVWVAAEAGGTWGTAEELPGIAALNKGGIAGAEALSCASAGNCSAGGVYQDKSGNQQAFVADEKNGTWGSAAEVPGTATLNKGGNAQITSVSCTSAGNCVAGGDYTGGSGTEAFTVTEKKGTWGAAKQVPGSAALNQGGFASVASLSCPSAGDCSAGGQYTDHSGHDQAFIVGEKNGAWGNAKQVPGTATLNKGGGAEITSLSCASPGNCGAGGFYKDSSGLGQVFVVDESNGTWGSAEQVPGTAGLNKGGSAQIAAVSCASVSHCGAGGFYQDNSGRLQAFVVSET
jgi:cytochrome c551/c552